MKLLRPWALAAWEKCIGRGAGRKASGEAVVFDPGRQKMEAIAGGGAVVKFLVLSTFRWSAQSSRVDSLTMGSESPSIAGQT